MASSAVRTAVKNKLDANWSALPVYFENEKKPASLPDSFVGVNFMDGGRDIAAIGGSGQHLYREDGDLVLSVYGPLNGGTDTIVAHLETLAALFQTQNLDAVQFLAASPPFPQDRQDSRYAMTILVQYFFDKAM